MLMFSYVVWNLLLMFIDSCAAEVGVSLLLNCNRKKREKKKKCLVHWAFIGPYGGFFWRIVAPLSNRIFCCSNFSWCFFCRLFIKCCVGCFKFWLQFQRKCFVCSNSASRQCEIQAQGLATGCDFISPLTVFKSKRPRLLVSEWYQSVTAHQHQ